MRQEKEIIWLETIFKLSRCRRGNPHHQWGLCSMCQLQCTHIMHWADILIQGGWVKSEFSFLLTAGDAVDVAVRECLLTIVGVKLVTFHMQDSLSHFVLLFFIWFFSFSLYTHSLVRRPTLKVMGTFLINSIIYCYCLYLTPNTMTITFTFIDQNVLHKNHRQISSKKSWVYVLFVTFPKCMFLSRYNVRCFAMNISFQRDFATQI